MGISHDIKPRKVYYPGNPKPKPKHSPREHKPSGNPEEAYFENYLPSNEKDVLEDEFFREQKPRGRHEDRPKKVVRILSAKRLVWFFAIIIIGIIIYQNYTDIRLSLSQVPNDSSSESTASYVSEPPQSTTSEESATSATTTTTTPTADADAATAAAQAKAALQVEVLNGNGISGSAESVKSTLIASGYTVVKVANAKTFTYTKTYIYYKTGKSAEATALAGVLANRSCTTQLSDTIAGTYDIVVVVGKT